MAAPGHFLAGPATATVRGMSRSEGPPPERQSPERQGPERRSQERLSGEGLVAEVRLVGGRWQGARVLDTSANGARLGVPGDLAASLPLGTLVELRLGLVGVEQRLEARAQTGNVRTVGEGAEVGLRFVERERLHAQLTPRLWERFNRRRRRRVRCLELGIPATLAAGTQTWTYPLHDVGEQGLALEVPFEEASALLPYELLRVTFTLPDGNGVSVAATLVHQTAFGHGARHGVAIDGGHTPSVREEAARIALFVSRTVLARRA